MLDAPVLIAVSLLYLGLLFAVAWWGDKRADQGRSIIANPTIYALSMAVYCTTWTFYGSVGRAAVSGIGFLPVYLGPTLVMALGWFVLLKMIRIVKANRITSIADFISSRYGKSHLLGGLVTIIAVVGIIPYIALQLKAVSSTVSLFLSYPEIVMPNRSPTLPVAADISFYIALILAAFTIVFGTRHLDATERHEGMVAAIALESGVKLVAFIAVGVFVTYGLYDGFGDIFEHVETHPELRHLTGAIPSGQGYTGWFSLIVLSAMAVLFLPRQFQVAVVENVNEAHLKRAAWLFSALSVADQSLRPADRAWRSAAFLGAGSRCRYLRPDLADVAAAGGSGAAGVHRWSVGGDRHGHRRNHRLVDHGLQRPGHAAAPAPSKGGA
jgi:Na+/proline symporter